jgi:hypothetical protein
LATRKFLQEANRVQGECAAQAAMERREPISITLADLLALVVGAALAVSLPQLHWPSDRITISNVSMPSWVAWLFVIAEAAMKVGLALVPVILARRARYGGLPKPADWLTILVALILLHEVVQRWEWQNRLARWCLVDLRIRLGYLPHAAYDQSIGGMQGDRPMYVYAGAPVDFTPGDEYLLWGWLAALLSLPLSLVLFFRWKTLPGGAKTALLLTVAFTGPVALNSLGSPGLIRGFEIIAARAKFSSETAVQLALCVARAPEALLLCVPVVAILVELRRRETTRWVWTKLIGATAAVLAISAWMVIYWYADLVNGRDPLASTRIIVNSLGLVVVALVSWLIVDHAGWAGTRSDRL